MIPNRRRHYVKRTDNELNLPQYTHLSLRVVHIGLAQLLHDTLTHGRLKRRPGHKYQQYASTKQQYRLCCPSARLYFGRKMGIHFSRPLFVIYVAASSTSNAPLQISKIFPDMAELSTYLSTGGSTGHTDQEWSFDAVFGPVGSDAVRFRLAGTILIHILLLFLLPK